MNKALMIAGAILSFLLVQLPSWAAPTPPRIPVIDVTDLYHPHQDVGDNFDLITAYALPELDLRAVVLDCTEPFRQPVAKDPGPGLFPDPNGPREPGFIPVLQLNHIFGRNVPCGTVPFTRMKSPGDRMLGGREMKTERTKELLKRFKDHGISHDPNNGLNYVLEYQDCIGHATQEEIYKFYESLDQRERELFCWSNMNCLSYDMAVDILKRTVIANYKAREERGLMEYFEKGCKELDAKKETIDKCRRYAHKIIREQREKIRSLEVRVENAKSEAGRAWSYYQRVVKEMSPYKGKAEKYDAIKGLLA